MRQLLYATMAALVFAIVPGKTAAQQAAWTWTDQPCGQEPREWPAELEPGDVDALIRTLQLDGYLNARHINTTSTSVCVSRGERRRLEVRFQDRTWLLTPAGLDSLALAYLEEQEESGLINAALRVSEVGLRDSQATLSLKATAGKPALLQGLLVSRQTRTSIRYLERVLGLRVGMTLSEFRADALQQRLRTTGLFSRVELPLLLPTSDSTAILQVILRDRAPGSFDLALGYLPGAGGKGALVGSGNLVLQNLFGGGRSMAVQLNRLPGQNSRFDARLTDPFLAGTGLGAEATFSGYQQDSTFSRQEYRLSGKLPLGASTLTATVSRTVARPGVAGARLQNGLQRIAASTGQSAGFGVEYRQTDQALVPRSGLLASVVVLRGRKFSDLREVQQADTVRVERSTILDRIEAWIRWHRPLGASASTVVGGHINAVVSDHLDAADLYRLGGASTLRGYDEDRFEGAAVGRVFTEARRHLDTESFVYGFVDVGFVNTGDALGTPSRTTVHPGFGVGGQLRTAAGLLNVSYALNRDDGPLNGRIHFGIAFGL